MKKFAVEKTELAINSTETYRVSGDWGRDRKTVDTKLIRKED
jgi:hypothetical protein